MWIVRGMHAALVSVLGLGAIGLAVTAAWAAGLRGGLCTNTPSGWIDVALLLFAVGLVIVVFLGTMSIDETPTLQRIFMGMGVVEAAAAVALVVYLLSKFTHAGWCG
jgi:hypothetical protein